MVLVATAVAIVEVPEASSFLKKSTTSELNITACKLF